MRGEIETAHRKAKGILLPWDQPRPAVDLEGSEKAGKAVPERSEKWPQLCLWGSSLASVYSVPGVGE